MHGTFPRREAGAVVVRDADGVCLDPPGVANAYCPPPGFQTSCVITALPEDCTARIESAQINAFVSELLCLTVTLDPDGAWDCSEVCNVGLAFSNWAQSVTPTGIVTAFCSTPEAITALAACLLSDDEPNVLSIGTDFKLKVDINTDGTLITGEGTPGSPITINIANLITGITTSATLKNALSTALVSLTANNLLTVNANGLYVNSAALVPVARSILTQHSLTGGGNLSADRLLNLVNDVAAPGNNMVYGTNGAGVKGWYAAPQGLVIAAPSGAIGGATAVDYVIPSNATWIVIAMHELGGNANNNFLAQIGDAGGIETSGYLGQASFVAGAQTLSAGFLLVTSTAANNCSGIMILSKLDTVSWSALAYSGNTTSNNGQYMGGSKALSAGPCDRLRLTFVGGTQTFDAQTKILVMYGTG